MRPTEALNRRKKKQARADFLFSSSPFLFFSSLFSFLTTQPTNNEQIQLPSWVDIVKTGAHKELAPYDPDWYYTRAASLARKVYLRQGLGVGALRRSYGGRDKSRGCAPERHALAAGGLVRHILQQLESIGIVEKAASGAKKGRRITPQGQRDLDLIAGRCPRDVKPVFGAQPEPPVEAVAADE